MVKLNAYLFAKYEHNFSRILFFCLLTTYGFFYTNNLFATDIMLKIDIAVWLLYWISHNFEKMAFKLSGQGRFKN